MPHIHLNLFIKWLTAHFLNIWNPVYSIQPDVYIKSFDYLRNMSQDENVYLGLFSIL